MVVLYYLIYQFLFLARLLRARILLTLRVTARLVLDLDEAIRVAVLLEEVVDQLLFVSIRVLAWI